MGTRISINYAGMVEIKDILQRFLRSRDNHNLTSYFMKNEAGDDPKYGESRNGQRRKGICARSEGEWSGEGRKNFRNDSD